MDTNYNNAVITSIDFVLINGVYRRRWNYTSSPNPNLPFDPGSIIEGIGNTNGLIEGTWSNIDFHNYLSCYLEDGTSLYADMYGGTCFVGVEEKNLYEQIEIYPNPFTTSISIYTADKIDKISIFTILGKEELVIEHPNSTNIDLSTLTKGIKILKISSLSKNYFSKILKF